MNHQEIEQLDKNYIDASKPRSAEELLDEAMMSGCSSAAVRRTLTHDNASRSISRYEFVFEHPLLDAGQHGFAMLAEQGSVGRLQQFFGLCNARLQETLKRA